MHHTEDASYTFLIHVPRLLERQVIPYTAKTFEGENFLGWNRNERSRENFRGSSFFYKNVYC